MLNDIKKYVWNSIYDDGRMTMSTRWIISMALCLLVRWRKVSKVAVIEVKEAEISRRNNLFIDGMAENIVTLALLIVKLLRKY